MGVRASQAYVSVLGTPNGATSNYELRVGRLYADVLVKVATANVLEHSASSDITLTHSAHGWDEEKSFTSAMTINQSADYLLFNSDQSVADTLSMTDTAHGGVVRPLSASNTLTLTSVGGRALTVSATDVIIFVDGSGHFNLVDDRKPCGDVITLTDLAEVSSQRVVTHTLGLTQTVNVRAPFRLTVAQVIALTSRTSTPWRFWLEDEMVIRQFIGIPLPTQHLSHTINLTQDSPIGMVWDTINLVQSANFAFSYTAENTMNLTDQVDVQGLWVRSVAHPSVVGHSLTWYEESKCGMKQYTPFQGETTIASDFVPPRDTLQDPQGDTSNFSLYTPYLGVATSKVTLRKPELDNRDRNAYTRINEETRGGRLVVYSDPMWPHVRTLAVTIIGLSESDVDALHDFMESTLGQEIGLTDWEGRLWKGVITNPNEAATQDGRDRWTVTFEFEGELLTVEQPGDNTGDGNGQTMNIQDSVTAVIE